MSVQVTVRYDDVYEALEPLRGLRLMGGVEGPPTSRLPLRRIVERAMSHRVVSAEEYRGSRVVAVRVDDETFLACHFGVEQPDDFCVCLGGGDAWARVAEAAERLSRVTRESYTLMLSAIIHALQGLLSAEEGEVEEVEDPDQVIEELLTWLPEYIAVTE